MEKRIAHITDTHLDEIFVQKQGILSRNRFKKVLQHISSLNIEDIICTGDIGEKTCLDFFFKECNNFKLSVTLGNHDIYKEVIPYLNIKTTKTSKLYYSELNTYFKFIYLDSSSGEIDSSQLLWLQNELETEKQIIIFLHHPIIGLQLKVDEIGSLKNRNAVRDLLLQRRAQITLFCGHYHLDDTTTYKNIKQYITPAVSYQIKKYTNQIAIDSKNYGYRIIQLNKADTTTTIQFMNDSN